MISGKWSASHLIRIILLGGLIVGLGACAKRPPATDVEALAVYKEINDPLEPMNRAVFKFNQGVEKVILRPVAKGYVAIIPKPARNGIRNALHNLRSPVILANDLLQGQPKRGGKTFARFLINSTLGIAGLFDVAKKFGLDGHEEDFGQTLAVWGGRDGPYLMLPFFGPSSVRDGIGRGADIVMDPFFWILRAEDLEYVNYARRGVEGIDLLAENIDELDQLKRDSLDFYAALRSAYRQDRELAIRNAEEEDELEVPDFIFENDPEDEGGG